MERVPTGRMKIDPAYQRPLSDVRVERMAAAWSPILAQAVDVSMRGGSLYVIDGQHRLAAARKAGISTLLAIIHEDLSPSEEAALFAKLNTLRSRPNTADIFRARVEAADDDALEIVAAAAKAGVTIELTAGGHSKRVDVTRAIGALIQLHSTDRTLVYQTLSTLRAAWPEDRQALTALPIYGVGGFIYTYSQHPRYEFARISRKLGEVSTGAFIRRATVLTEASSSMSGGGGTFLKAGPRRAVLEAFNRDLRGNRLPDATLRDYKALAAGRNPWVDPES